MKNKTIPKVIKKTITVEDDAWSMLTKLKHDLRHDNLSITIRYLFYELENSKLKEEVNGEDKTNSPESFKEIRK